MDNNGKEMRKPVKKTINKGSKKSKPVKVVYISNPVKINANASEFMALVQELTGRDSELPDPARFGSASSNRRGDDVFVTRGRFEQPSASFDTDSSASTNSGTNFMANPHHVFGEDDDVFMPGLEGFPVISPSSSFWYESPHQAV